MNVTRFSEKQKTAMLWWVPGSGYAGKEALICDGAVRSGKTLAMGLGFFLWAMSCFEGRRFALCGKTIAALRRNGSTAAVLRKPNRWLLRPVQFAGKRLHGWWGIMTLRLFTQYSSGRPA